MDSARKSQKKTRGFESKAHRRILNISYTERKTNILVNNLINEKVDSYIPLLNIIMRRKMTTFRHITRHDSMSKTILQCHVEGNRKRVRPKKNWLNDIFEYSNLPIRQLLIIAKDRSKWRKLLKHCHVLPLPCQRHGTK